MRREPEVRRAMLAQAKRSYVFGRDHGGSALFVHPDDHDEVLASLGRTDAVHAVGAEGYVPKSRQAAERVARAARHVRDELTDRIRAGRRVSPEQMRVARKAISTIENWHPELHMQRSRSRSPSM